MGRGTYYAGQGNFDPGEDIDICQVDAVLTKLGYGDISAETCYCQIYSDDSNKLGVLLGESDGVSCSNDWDKTIVEFTFSSAVSLSDGSEYHIVLTLKGLPFEPWIGVSMTMSSVISGYFAQWDSDKTRNYTWAGYDARFNVYTD